MARLSPLLISDDLHKALKARAGGEYGALAKLRRRYIREGLERDAAADAFKLMQLESGEWAFVPTAPLDCITVAIIEED